MLYKVFIDDSGKKDYPNPYAREFVDNPPSTNDYREFWKDNYFVLCGVKVKQTDIGEIDKIIRGLKIDCFRTDDVEIKSTWLRIPYQRKKHYLDLYDVSDEQLNKFGDDLFEIFNHNEDRLKLFGVVFDKRFYGDAKRKMPDGDPLLKTTQVLLEKINRSSQHNILVFDQMEESLSKDRGNHRAMLGIWTQNDGMEQIYQNKYENIIDIKFDRSTDDNFLQLADLCAYSLYRQFIEYGREWVGQEEPSKNDGKNLGTYSYFEKISGNFSASSFSGMVRGTGISCIPDIGKKGWSHSRDKKDPS